MVNADASDKRKDQEYQVSLTLQTMTKQATMDFVGGGGVADRFGC